MDAFRALLTSTVPFLPITITWLEALFVVEALRYLVLPAVRNYLLPLLQGGRGWRHYVRSGEWAVVTGGSDGIGKAYAAELLARGMNVLIIARSKDKLEGVCAELRGAVPGQRVEYHVADFSAPGIYADIGASACERRRAAGAARHSFVFACTRCVTLVQRAQHAHAHTPPLLGHLQSSRRSRAQLACW